MWNYIYEIKIYLKSSAISNAKISNIKEVQIANESTVNTFVLSSDGQGLTWMAAVGPRRVVQDDHTGQIMVDHRQVFNITTKVQRTVLNSKKTNKH